METTKRKNEDPSALMCDSPSKKTNVKYEIEVIQNGESAIGEFHRQPSRTTDALNGCEQVILKVVAALEREKNEKCQNRVNSWKKKLEEIRRTLEIPNVPIAVIGATGAGKSSLINAVVDQFNVLPTSGTEACTSVVVKIENNPRYGFEAEILFLEREEWQKEKDLLIKDMTKNDGTRRKNVNADDGSPAGVAYLKMKAVYGDFTSVADLEQENIITSRLGNKELIQKDSLEEFREEVEKYIVSTVEEGEHFWPIIKMVTIRISGFDTGCTLVDLPGVGDANAARNGVAEEYLQKCSNFLVVAVVQRALSEKTAKNFLGESFRRKLKMDGNYTSDAVKFVCTKNDDLDPNELVRELKLDADVKTLRDECTELSKKLKSLEGSGRYELEKQREKNLKKIKMMCGKARSEKAKRQLKIDFRKGLKAFKRSEFDDDEDTEDEDDEDEDESLEVFCVSSKDYRHLKENDPSLVFENEEDTEIPALRKWMKDLGYRNKQRITREMMDKLEFFLKSVKNYLQCNDVEFTSDEDIVKTKIKKISEDLDKDLKHTAAKLYDELIKDVGSIEKDLNIGQEVAEKEALNTFRKLNYHVNTWKAMICRNGIFRSKVHGNIDLNDDLSSPLSINLLFNWCEFFSETIFDRMENYCERMRRNVEESLDKVTDVVDNIVPEQMIVRMRCLVIDNARMKLNEKVFDLRRKIEYEQRKIHRCGFDTVKSCLEPTYSTCPDRGEGLKKMINLHLEDGINKEKDTMFSRIKEALTRDLKLLMQTVINEILKVCSELVTYLLERFEPLWLHNTKQLTIVDDINEAYEEIQDLCNSHEIELNRNDETLNTKIASPKTCQDKSTKVFRPDDLKIAIKLSITDYDKQEYAENRLKRFCSSHGMEFRGNTPGNGNCFFEAISSQLGRLNLYQSPEELRQNVTAYLRLNPTYQANNTLVDMKDFVEDFAKYCDRMSNDKEWADHVIVIAMARMLQMDILIITSSPDTQVDNSLVWVDGGNVPSDTLPLLVGHFWERHYQSLQPKGVDAMQLCGWTQEQS